MQDFTKINNKKRIISYERNYVKWSATNLISQIIQ